MCVPARKILAPMPAQEDPTGGKTDRQGSDMSIKIFAAILRDALRAADGIGVMPVTLEPLKLALTTAFAFSGLPTRNPFQGSGLRGWQGSASLVMAAEYPNDVTAIIEARQFLRNGETIEIWREGTLT
jgi:hypothetical protein